MGTIAETRPTLARVTEEQLEALRRLGVPLGQGWHLGVPTIVN